MSLETLDLMSKFTTPEQGLLKPYNGDLEALRREISYDPGTGLFTRLTHRKLNGPQGRYLPGCAGTIDSHGYVQISVFGKLWRGHRLAFLLMMGALPEAQLDHINGVRNDNRWANLRVATSSQNRMNERKRAGTTSQFKGVSWNTRLGKWVAQIKAGGTHIWLGAFDDESKAAEAYIYEARKLHGEFRRDR